jgi:3-oxoacyl-[acyl-carrier-protein] synthase-3
MSVDGAPWHVIAFKATRDSSDVAQLMRPVRELRARILFDDGRRPDFRDPDGSYTDVQDLDYGAWHFIARREVDGPPLGYVRLATPAAGPLFQSREYLGAERYDELLRAEGLNPDHVFEHSRLVVERQARRLGLGRYLNAHAIAAAHCLGAAAMIGTSGTADGQDGFHQRFGFRPVPGTRRFMPRYTEDVLIMLHKIADGAGEFAALVGRLRVYFPAVVAAGLVPERPFVPPRRRERSRERRPVPLPVAVAGTGVHLPGAIVTNQALAETLDTSDEWIVARTGIRERRRLAPELATSDMCAASAGPALADAGLRAADLDAIIVATYTYDQPLPSTALIVKDTIGAHRAMALDVTQAACASGVHALLIAAHLLRDPAMNAILVIAADCASRVTDPGDRTTSVFFGDAAAALVLVRTGADGAGLLGYDIGSQLSDAVRIPAGGSRRPASLDTVRGGQHYLHMNGRAVWDTAVDRLPASIATAARKAGLAVTEIPHFFLHQANLNILSQTMARLGVPPERAPVTLDKLGNTGAAGMFTALHHTYSRGLLRPGDTYVVSGIGAGFHWGSLCFRHG